MIVRRVKGMKKTGLALVLTGAVLTGAVLSNVFTGDSVSASARTQAAPAIAATQTAEEKADNEGLISTVSTEELETQEAESQPFSYANVADVAEAVMPSIVAITNKSVQEVRSFFYGRAMQYEAESAGSGIIVGSNDTELLICTNNHVVENASELTVSFIDEESCAAQTKGTDPSNDLAVVAVKLEDIPQETMDAIKIAKIGDSDSMRVGEQVVAIGNALGYGQSVTTGIISAKDRSIQTGSSYGQYSRNDEEDTSVYENLIQTDAAINPGNSGGALLDMNGRVIGINSAKASASGVEGMGYAIPISKAMPILEDLMNRKTRTKLDASETGYLGINGRSVPYDATYYYGIPSGLYLTLVEENGPAYNGGLREGDIITAFDGESISSLDDLQYYLQYYAAGETVNVTVATPSANGGYTEETMQVTLGAREGSVQ